MRIRRAAIGLCIILATSFAGASWAQASTPGNVDGQFTETNWGYELRQFGVWSPDEWIYERAAFKGVTVEATGQPFQSYIYALGSVGKSKLLLARYLPSGKLDESFSDDGFLKDKIPVGGKERPVMIHGDALAVDAHHRILTGGSVYDPVSERHQLFVTRYLPSGERDTTFGDNGVVLLPAGGGAADWSIGSAAADLLVDAEGRVVVGGFATDDDEKYPNLFLGARLMPTGKVDPNFGGGDGLFTKAVGTGIDSGFSGERAKARANAVALDDAGRVVLAGTAAVADHQRQMLVMRLTVDGALDPSFDSNGVAEVAFVADGQQRAQAEAIVVQGNKIVVGGSAWGPPAPFKASDPSMGFAMARLDVDGSLDPTFGEGGRQWSQPSLDDGMNRWSRAFDLVAQPDGALIIGGAASYVPWGNYVWPDAKMGFSSISVNQRWDAHAQQLDPAYTFPGIRPGHSYQNFGAAYFPYAPGYVNKLMVRWSKLTALAMQPNILEPLGARLVAVGAVGAEFGPPPAEEPQEPQGPWPPAPEGMLTLIARYQP